MALNDTALVTLAEAKEYLRVNAATNLQVYAEHVGTGDGSDKTFSLDNTPVGGSLKLYVNNVLQTETTHYSISGADITFVTAPTSTYPITASYDKTASSNTFESYEDLLLENLIEAATKKAEEYTGRAFIQRSITEYHTGDGSNSIWLFFQPVDSITSVVVSLSEAIGTGDGSDTTFSLSEVPTASSLTLYVDAVVQTVTTDYTISGADITFVSAPSADAKITAKYTHTILAINEYAERLPVGRLQNAGNWVNGLTYKIIYVAGYASTRAATQALVPDVVSAVLLILANLYENRTDQLKSESVAGLGSVAYALPSQAEMILSLYRTSL